MTQQEYISRWHKLFVDNVRATLGYIEGKMVSSTLSDECKDKLTAAKLFLQGQDILDVERELSLGIVTDATLDKTETIYVKIAEFFIDENIHDDATRVIMKDFVKQYEHYQREITHLQLDCLNIRF